jgi:hypothetical protein
MANITLVNSSGEINQRYYLAALFVVKVYCPNLGNQLIAALKQRNTVLTLGIY